MLSSFDINKIDLNNPIDSGSYGTVHPYLDPQEHERFVVKVAQTDKFSNFLGYIQEIVLGFSCDHANVLPVRGYHINYLKYKNLWSVYIKLDRMKCSLKSRINEQKLNFKYFSQKEIVNYFYEMSCGLDYLHKRGIAHRDIKPANILISKNEEIKIADIGSGKFVGDEKSFPISGVAGTYCYNAPEIFKLGREEDCDHLKKNDFFKADIWSLGVVIAEMCLRKLEVVNINMSGKKNQVNIINQLKEKKIYDKALIDLIESLIRPDPAQRNSLQDILKTLKEKFGNELKVKKQT